MEIETTGPTAEDTTGKTGEEEKLLPPGDPVLPAMVVPPKDLLHGENAVTAPQEQQKAAEKSPEQTWAERDLRETGLKEALPRGMDAPTKVTVPVHEEDGLPKMHTYAEDMGKEIQKRGETISSIITAERMRGDEEPPATASAGRRTPWRLILTGGAALLIVLGVGAVGAAFFFGQKTTGSTPASPSLIPVNASVTISENDTTPLAELLGGARGSAQMNLGDIEALAVATGTAPESAEDVLSALGAPNELARNSTGILVGLHAFNHVQPFLIVSVSAYDRAFEAMLAWEPDMATGLGAFFAPSGTPQGITDHPPELSFTDNVSDNIDVRESQAAWPILYAFPRQGLLVITTNESTLREILTRLSLQNASNK